MKSSTLPLSLCSATTTTAFWHDYLTVILRRREGYPGLRANWVRDHVLSDAATGLAAVEAREGWRRAIAVAQGAPEVFSGRMVSTAQAHELLTAMHDAGVSRRAA